MFIDLLLVVNMLRVRESSPLGVRNEESGSEICPKGVRGRGGFIGEGGGGGGGGGV